MSGLRSSLPPPTRLNLQTTLTIGTSGQYLQTMLSLHQVQMRNYTSIVMTSKEVRQVYEECIIVVTSPTRN